MTHGLCGKEGAMVFKRVLKGIGRLMLTTAVMCGVGLFLCSSEVKAAVNVGVAAGTAENGNLGAFIVTVTAGSGDDISNIKEIQLFDDTSTLLYTKTIDEAVDTASDGINKSYNITPGEFINSSAVIAKDFKNGQKATIKKAAVKYIKKSNSTEDTNESNPVTLSSKPIYKVSADKDNANTFSAVRYDPSSSYIYEVGGENRQYGYENETFKIKHGDTSYTNYYMLVKECPTDSNSFAPDDDSWQEGIEEIKSGTLGPDKSYEVAYLPKVTGISVSKSSDTINTKLLGTENSKSLSAISGSIEEISTDITFGIDSFISSEESSSDKSAIQGYYKIECTPYLASTNTPMTLTVPNDSVTSSIFKLKMKLNSTASGGAGKVVIKLVLGNYEVAHVDLPVSLSIKATGFELNSTTVSLMAGVEQQFDIIKAITPAGANQDLSNYDGTVTVTSGSELLDTRTYAAGKLTLKTKPSVTSGTATVQIKLKDNTTLTDLAPQTLTVKIISLSKDNTIKSINKNNKNYITYNKDKGYSLDIKQLIIDNAKDTSDNTVTITKDQITNVSVGGSPCTDGIWKPSEAATNKEVKCKVNGVQIDGIRVSAYPMPTATYSSSNRTLSVKIPTKVATAYSDDNNIRQSKGFKLILEDSSGNTLYEYTDSKYQSVLSSSSESTVSYTVTASDIKGMITSAASNGKFSADTTSVKFKVIPMGYKQSSTSDETIKAKDEIAGKTDAVTVYKVSASGTNFTSSAAYGLDGQTVSITATPNSGYSFKQWSDGNTSNPRQVKVSASGTRSFQAVAGDRVANSTGAGGTDNSELYDDVPKTAESNSAIWLIVFMVFAVMGTTYALYLQLKAANSKHDR